jgi:hypothetical protein
VEPRPITPETWEKLPPEVQAYILVLENALRQSLERITQLERKVNELEAGLIEIPAILLSPHPKTHPRLPKTKEKKVGANPVVNLDTRAIIGNWRRLRKWIRSWSIGRKRVPIAGVYCRRMRADQFLPWSDIRSGNCLKFVLWLKSTV